MLRRFLASLRRGRLEGDMEEEMRLHIAMQEREYLGEGMPPEEARRRAMARFGRVRRIKEHCREERRLPAAEAFGRDLRLGVRLLRRQPGFAAAVIATLAIGIGANTAIFTVVRNVLLRPLPLPDPSRLVVIWENDRIRGTAREGASFPDYLDIESGTSALEALAACHRGNATITGAGEPERVPAGRVTAGYFRVMGLAPLLGRTFAAAEHARGNDAVALISEDLWHRRFAADRGVLGRQIVVDGAPRLIVGVMPRDLGESLAPFQREALWVPLAPANDDFLRGRHMFRVFGRLKRGVSIEAAQSEVSGIMRRLEQQYPNDNQGRGAAVEPLHEQVVGSVQRPLQVLAGAVALVLLIGCLNVANLLLARLSAREREIAVRVAMGAGRGRVLAQLLAEGLILAGAGGILGFALAAAGVRALAAAAAENIPRLELVRVDWSVPIFAAAVALATALVFAGLPAATISRRALHEALKSAGRSLTETPASRRLRHALVVFEVAFAFVLLASATLLLNAFRELRNTDPGYDPRGVLQVTTELPDIRYPAPSNFPFFERPELTGFADRLVETLRAAPAVESADIASHNPLFGSWTTRVTVAGRPAPPEGEQDEAEFCPIGERYLQTLRVPLLRGRHFVVSDDGRHPLVAIVSDAFVRKHFPGEDPIGRSIRVFGPAREIVGIAGDVRLAGLDAPPQPVMYLPFRQNPIMARLHVVVRSRAGNAESLAGTVRRAIWALDRDLALFDERALDRGLAASLAVRRFTAVLLAGFAAVAVVLAALGIYAVVNYSVAQRRREIGIRMAIGAGRGVIVRQETAAAMVRVAAGLALGAGGAIASRRVLHTVIADPGNMDVMALAGAALLLALVALAACARPAARASRIDPVSALRAE